MQGAVASAGTEVEVNETPAPVVSPLDLYCSELPIEWYGSVGPVTEGLWLIQELVPATGLGVVYGHPGCGKSFLALDLALHVALGKEWHGRPAKKGVAVYLAAEGMAGLRNRVAAQKKHYGIDEAPFAVIPLPVDLQSSAEGLSALKRAIGLAAARYELPPALLVIDTLSKTFGSGKENTDDMARYLTNCASIAAMFSCFVLIVHHRPKGLGRDDPRGHSSLIGGVDTILSVRDGPVRTLQVTKQRDGDAGQRTGFTLQRIEVGCDSMGKAVTSCVVRAAGASHERHSSDGRARLPEGARRLLMSLDALAEQFGSSPPPDISQLVARDVTVIELNLWRDRVIEEDGTVRDISRETSRKAFQRGLARLQSDGIVGVSGKWAWCT